MLMKIIYRNIGIIVVHGFGGTINEIEPLCKKLKILGYPVITPVLTGHNGSKKEFKKATYKEWIEDVEEAYLSLNKKCDEIILIGFSMGGLIALQVARKYKVKSIITLNTPIFLIGIRAFLIKVMSDFLYFRTKNIKKYFKTMKRIPINAYLNFTHLLKDTKNTLHEIECDILITQAYQDDVVHCRSANFLHDHVKSQNKKLMFYHKCKHILLHSEMSDEIMIDLVKYIEAK